jgi:glycosyltransferase involved in cell wall biosynthesis
MKLAFVIPWYGDRIPGGAEAACRSLVRMLSREGFQVEVLTTCVREFASDWNVNHHPEGLSLESGIPVRRFPVRVRDQARFDAVNARLMRGEIVPPEDEQAYVGEMIHSPALCDYIGHRRNDGVFFFLPYMFGTTYWGSAVCPERSVLVPCLHDEAYARMDLFRSMMRRVRAVIFLSEEERDLAFRLYGLAPCNTRVIGLPFKGGCDPDAARFARRYGLSGFLLYAGRTDEGKNAGLLVDYFCRYAEETDPDARLVFIGGGQVAVPARHANRVVRLGFLSPEDKHDCLAAALALCVPSRAESFSMVMMESWLAGRPAIVNAACPVTTGFCRRASAGLWFSAYEDFREIVWELRANPALARALGRNGARFVRENFTSELIAARYRDLLATFF